MWDGYVVGPCLWLFDTVVLMLTPPHPNAVRSGAGYVRLDAIGDFILWFHSGLALADREQAQHRVLIANSVWADYARSLGCWDEVIPVDTRRFGGLGAYRMEVLRRARREGFAVVINPIHSRRFAIDDALVRASAATERVGWALDTTNAYPWQMRWSNAIYTRRVVVATERMAEWRRNLVFACEVGGQSPPPAFKRLPVLARVDYGRFAGGYVAIALGASWSGKVWPVESFAEVCRRIRSQTGLALVLLGDAADRPACDAVAAQFGGDAANFAGRLDLAQSVEWLRGARVLVANDSAMVHAAAAVGTPSVCVLGGGHFGRFLPYGTDTPPGLLSPRVVFRTMECYGCSWRCTQPHAQGRAMPCIAAVSINMVWNEIEKALADGDVVHSQPSQGEESVR